MTRPCRCRPLRGNAPGPGREPVDGSVARTAEQQRMRAAACPECSLFPRNTVSTGLPRHDLDCCAPHQSNRHQSPYSSSSSAANNARTRSAPCRYANINIMVGSRTGPAHRIQRVNPNPIARRAPTAERTSSHRVTASALKIRASSSRSSTRQAPRGVTGHPQLPGWLPREQQGPLRQHGRLLERGNREADRNNIQVMQMALDSLIESLLDNYHDLDTDSQRLVPRKRIFRPRA